MPRRQQYLDVVASALAVAWIATGIYAALDAVERQPIAAQPVLLQIAYLPYTLAVTFGRPVSNALGIGGAILALVVLWLVFAVGIWGVLELIARRFTR